MGILRYFYFFLLLAFPIAELGKFNIGSISFSLNDLIVLIIGLSMIPRLKEISQKSFLGKPIIIFLAVSVVSLIVNIFNYSFVNVLVSFMYIVRWASYSFLYFFLIWQSKESVNKFRNFLIIPIFVVLFIGALQFIFYQNLRNLYYLGWDEHLYRLFSSFLDPNFAAAFLSLSLIFLIYLSIQYFNEKKYLIFTILSLISIVNFVEIFLTYSRSGLIMLVVSLVAYLVLSKKVKFIIILIFLFFAMVIFSPKSFSTEGTNIFRFFSAEARIQSAQVAISIIERNPVIGVGFNAYRYAQNRYGYLMGIDWQTTHSGAGTDNSFLFVLATTGFIGLVSYVYLIYKMLYLGKLKMKEEKFAIVFISILLGVIVNSLFINSLFYVYIMEFIWIFAAITEKS